MSLKKGTIAIAITAVFSVAQADFVAVLLGTGGATYNVVSDNPAGESSIIVGGGQFVEATPNNGGETEPTEPVDDGVATITCQPGDAEYITRSELDTMIANGDPVEDVCTSGITDFSSLFFSDFEFDQDISRWDVSNGVNFSTMFAMANTFNQDIGDWDVSKGVNFSFMFSGANNFNKDVGGWDVSSGQSFNYMFDSVRDFNQDIGDWDVSNGTNFEGMFGNTVSFDKDIGGWDVSSGVNFNRMFFTSNSFTQDISGWDTTNAASWFSFKDLSALTDANTPPKFL